MVDVCIWNAHAVNINGAGFVRQIGAEIVWPRIGLAKIDEKYNCTDRITYIMDILSFYFSHGKISTTVKNATLIIASLPAIFNQLEGD